MTELPLNLEKGDIVAIDDVEYVFARIDPDGLVTLRTLRKNVEFHLTDPQTGFPRKPNANDIARLMASGSFVKRAKDLEDGPRRAARKRELDAKAARAVDPVSEFRITFTREYDRAPYGRSDRALRVFNDLLKMKTRVARSTSSALAADGNVLDHFGGWAAPSVDIANTDSGEA